jgi:hypothetical protein
MTTPQVDPRIISEIASCLTALDPDRRCDVLLQAATRMFGAALVKGYTADAAGDIAMAFHNAVAAELMRDPLGEGHA